VYVSVYGGGGGGGSGDLSMDGDSDDPGAVVSFPARAWIGQVPLAPQHEAGKGVGRANNRRAF
jgi:hypothetical protein